MRSSTLHSVAIQLLVFALASALFLVSGCRREEITHHRVKKVPGATYGSSCPVSASSGRLDGCGR